jgi:hypothetical protein
LAALKKKRGKSMHRSNRLAITALALASLPAASTLAHHSYTMFDMEKSVTLEGTVKEVQWTNPHIWVQLVVKDPATGKEVEWSCEGNSPNMLVRAGWNRHALNTGDRAIVVVHPVKGTGNPYSGSLASVTVNSQRIFGGQNPATTQENK